MRTLLFVISAGFFIAAVISWAQRYLDTEHRVFVKYQILEKIRRGETVKYNKDIEELIEAGLVEYRDNNYFAKY